MTILQKVADFILISGILVMVCMILAPIFLSKYMETKPNDQ